ncbi:hypothetical protein D3C73_1477830 [compost metagenome]
MDSSYRRPRYSPISPSAINCTPPRNRITAIIVGQPATRSPYIAALAITQMANTKATLAVASPM